VQANQTNHKVGVGRLCGEMEDGFKIYTKLNTGPEYISLLKK